MKHFKKNIGTYKKRGFNNRAGRVITQRLLKMFEKIGFKILCK